MRTAPWAAQDLFGALALSSWSDPPQPAEIVEAGVRACDQRAPGGKCMGGVKGVSRRKPRLFHQCSCTIDHRAFGRLQLQRERVQHAPRRSQAPPRCSHRPASIGAVCAQRIAVSVIAQPGEDEPVGELVDDQAADHTCPIFELPEYLRAPGLDRRRGAAGPAAQMRVDEVRIQIAAAQGDRSARSRAGSTGSGQFPARSSSSSPGRAGPAEPAACIQVFAVSPPRLQSDPGPTPSARESAPIVFRSTRVARPARMLLTVLRSSPAFSASCRAPQPRCAASSATLQVIVGTRSIIPSAEDLPRRAKARRRAHRWWHRALLAREPAPSRALAAARSDLTDSVGSDEDDDRHRGLAKLLRHAESC